MKISLNFDLDNTFILSPKIEKQKTQVAELCKLIEANDPSVPVELDLGEISSNDDYMELFSKALEKNTTIQHLKFKSGDKLTAQGAQYLANALRVNKSLLGLTFDNDSIEPNSLKKLIMGLKENNTLKTLDISGVELGEFSDNKNVVIPLSKLLENNTSITELNLSGCDIYSAGMQRLCKALEKNTTIQNLDLSGNKLNKTAITALSNAFKNNTSLTDVDLSECKIDKENMRHLEKLLEHNRNFLTLQNRLGNMRGKAGDDKASWASMLVDKNNPHALPQLVTHHISSHVNFAEIDKTPGVLESLAHIGNRRSNADLIKPGIYLMTTGEDNTLLQYEGGNYVAREYEPSGRWQYVQLSKNNQGDFNIVQNPAEVKDRGGNLISPRRQVREALEATEAENFGLTTLTLNGNSYSKGEPLSDKNKKTILFSTETGKPVTGQGMGR